MRNFNSMIGDRIQQARKAASLSQEELSRVLGFNDRQILSNIEAGKRKVSADELVRFVDSLQRPLEYFTDPFLISEEGAISWRTEASGAALTEFENWAKTLIGSQRRLAQMLNEKISPLRFHLPLTTKSSYEDAWNKAEALVDMWSLGKNPAARLKESVETEMGVMVLYVDAPAQVSGGACNLPEISTIFINRTHSLGRRNFTLAHELFHLLTWTNMPPPKFDFETESTAAEVKQSRQEHLADQFAAALLMPFASLEEKWKSFDSATMAFKKWVTKTAEFFLVSPKALHNRLRWVQEYIALLKEYLKLEPEKLHYDVPAPSLYSAVFIKRLHAALTKGLLTARKAAELLDLSLDGLSDLFSTYQLDPCYDL
jgi:Zn-dependent peptidase ImmA (M78 family)/DNA-binding XRE family transcriptional regulator